MSVRKIFDKYFNGSKNFITPNVYEYGERKFGDYFLFYEKSRGEGFNGEDLFAITFLIMNKGAVRRIDLSKCFNSKKEVDDYLKSITSKDITFADKYGEIKSMSELY